MVEEEGVQGGVDCTKDVKLGKEGYDRRKMAMLTGVIGGIRSKIFIGLIASFLNIYADQRLLDFCEKVRVF